MSSHPSPAGTVTVSIITPCYNGARYLEETLASAAAQSHPPLEHIVIDDGSTDDSAAIAERFGGLVRVLRQTNHGESVARNRGLREARGSHVLFLDADDLLAVDALKHLSEALEGKPGAVALMGCSWFIGDPATPHTVKEWSYRSFYPDIIESNFAPPLCWLAPTDVVKRAGGFAEDMSWFEDWDLWWRVGLDEPTLVTVPYVGAKYRQHPQSQLATTSPANRARGHAALMGRMAKAIIARPPLLEQHGGQLFWSVWTALVRARAQSLSWEELEPLTSSLDWLVRNGPPSVRSSRSGRLIRWVGLRAALALQRS